MTTKWIYKIKRGSSGQLDRLKARIVARGFEQTQSVDYFDTYAPVVRWNAIHMILALAAQKQWKLHQLDVKMAFLYGKLNGEVYMEIPHSLKHSR